MERTDILQVGSSINIKRTDGEYILISDIPICLVAKKTTCSLFFKKPTVEDIAKKCH